MSDGDFEPEGWSAFDDHGRMARRAMPDVRLPFLLWRKSPLSEGLRGADG